MLQQTIPYCTSFKQPFNIISWIFKSEHLKRSNICHHYNFWSINTHPLSVLIVWNLKKVFLSNEDFFFKKKETLKTELKFNNYRFNTIHCTMFICDYVAHTQQIDNIERRIVSRPKSLYSSIRIWQYLLCITLFIF